MAEGAEPVIRVIKKKGGHGGHHGGAWKVAYADFVTAMMAFFLVMWILGLSKPQREAIASFFRGESGFMKTVKGPIISPEGPAKETGQNAPIIPADAGQDSIRKLLEQVQAEIKRDLQGIPELKGLSDNVEIEMTKEGLRIQLIEKTSSLFFDSGSAHMKPTAVHLLQSIAHQLKDLKNPVVIEGHTDRRPLGGSGGYSNWELSADRANAARRVMEMNGLEGRIASVRGYADRRLKTPEDPFHFSNRRVSILVAFKDLDKIDK